MIPTWLLLGFYFRFFKISFLLQRPGLLFDEGFLGRGEAFGGCGSMVEAGLDWTGLFFGYKISS